MTKTKSSLTILLIMFSIVAAKAQTKWFSVYDDSAVLIRDAYTIISQMNGTIQKANPDFTFPQCKVVKNTTPGLSYFLNDTINLPIWAEVIPEQKQFFAKVAGSKRDGKEVFGLLFNGFYLAHEAGHFLAQSTGKIFTNSYDGEYDANTIAILYWRSAGETDCLKKCYAYIQKMLKVLKDPVPAGEDYKKYVTEHYDELSIDPYKYGYIQFSQFVEIYNDKTLPGFITFIRNYLK